MTLWTQIKEIIAATGYATAIAGVIVIIGGFIWATIAFLASIKNKQGESAYKDFRRNLGRVILLGLEFLIAGDIINTVVVSTTLEHVAVLAIIILIRTFLGITLHLEVEGRWPWQKP